MKSVAEICDASAMGEEAKALLRDGMPPQEFVSALAAKQLYPEAVRFLAYSLPKREAVWWAWVCARRTAGASPAPKIKAALDATERWIAQPNEDNRRQAMQTAQDAEFGTAAGSAALGAFLSSGSMGPPEAPPVPPGEFLTAGAVAGAIILAAVSVTPEKAPENFRGFIEQGMEVARRIRLWEGN